MNAFGARYGPWALVAGASVGLGECFARSLAARGLNLLLVARRPEPLEALAAALRSAHGVEVRTLPADLGTPEGVDATLALAREVEVGLLVHNAAASAIGPFLDRPLREHLSVVDVNCRSALVLCHELGREMALRGRGGLLIMSSLAGMQGGVMVSSYAASKAFEIVLGEGLWSELRPRGVDVLVCRAGPTRTPGYASSRPRKQVAMMDPEPVVEEALASLHRGPIVVTGTTNKVAAFLFERVMPRRWVIEFIGRTTREMYE